MNMTLNNAEMKMHLEASMNDESILSGLRGRCDLHLLPILLHGEDWYLRKQECELKGYIHEGLGIVTHRCSRRKHPPCTRTRRRTLELDAFPSKRIEILVKTKRIAKQQTQ